MKEMAATLQITLRTVAGHKYSVMELFRVNTNAKLFQYAIKHRIISL
jgi:DNA-binding CsgD family transcriptional regulator